VCSDGSQRSTAFTAQIGDTEWQTSLFPKEGAYLVPVKTWVRKADRRRLTGE